jgi:hypothetical protein
MVLIAYYLVFCLLCCVGLVALMRRDKGRTEQRDES